MQQCYFQLRIIPKFTRLFPGSSRRQKMSTAQEDSQQQHVDYTPIPSDIPHVDEVGATSAPLKSAAFFIGAYCKDYNGSFRSILREYGSHFRSFNSLKKK